MTDEIQQVTTVPPAKCRSMRFVYAGILIALVCLLAFTVMQLLAVNQRYEKHIADARQSATSTRDSLTEVTEKIATLTSSLDKADATAKEQQQAIASLQAAANGNMNKWLIAESIYLVKMAGNQLAIAKENAPTLSLLQQAQATLARINDENLQTIKQSIADDIATLQNAAPIDVNTLYGQLQTVDSKIETLPLPPTPLSANHEVVTIPTDAPWWKKGLLKTWQGLQQIVIVRNVSPDALPLVLPDQKIFLMQNLHVQLQQAMLALLQRQQTVYAASLTQTAAWVSRYFVQDDANTIAVLAMITDLQKVSIALPEVDLAALLSQLESYQSAANTVS